MAFVELNLNKGVHRQIIFLCVPIIPGSFFLVATAAYRRDLRHLFGVPPQVAVSHYEAWLIAILLGFFLGYIAMTWVGFILRLTAFIGRLWQFHAPNWLSKFTGYLYARNFQPNKWPLNTLSQIQLRMHAKRRKHPWNDATLRAVTVQLMKSRYGFTTNDLLGLRWDVLFWMLSRDNDDRAHSHALLGAFHACAWCGLLALYLNRNLLNRGFAILELLLGIIAVYDVCGYFRELYWTEEAVITQERTCSRKSPHPPQRRGRKAAP